MNSCRNTKSRYRGGESITEEEPIAAWEALLLPDWRWEAFQKEDEELYYGRVKSPKTHDRWEYGYFTREQLKQARAYRVDTDLEGEPLFPDGGYKLSEVLETELTALYEPYPDEDEGVDN